MPNLARLGKRSKLAARSMWLKALALTSSGAYHRQAFAAVARGLGVALLASLTALGLAVLLDPWLHQSVFVLFLGAVTLNAWYGGLAPGLLTTVCGALTFNKSHSFPTSIISLRASSTQSQARPRSPSRWSRSASVINTWGNGAWSVAGRPAKGQVRRGTRLLTMDDGVALVPDV